MSELSWPPAAIRQSLADDEPALRSLVQAVADDPELPLSEHHAAARQTAFLAERGFAVTPEAGGLPTAFLADFRQNEAAEEVPSVALFSEYDALPELGHACGHPLIMGAAVAAGCILKKQLEKSGLPGRVTVVGSPGEEGKGGKLALLKAHCLDQFDAALEVHPFFATGITRHFLGIFRCDVEFFGRSAHAAVAPWAGINALDALNLLYAGIGAWRQQFTPDMRVHGIITDGGGAANVIPEHTSAFFYLRAATLDGLNAMQQRFRAIVDGAALMTGCRARIVPHDCTYEPGTVNPALAEAVEAAAQALGMAPEADVPDALSTDFGNVSNRIPGVNFYFQVAPDSSAPLHSEAFRDFARTPEAFAKMLDAAAALAFAGWKVLSDPIFRNTVKTGFAAGKEQRQ